MGLSFEKIQEKTGNNPDVIESFQHAKVELKKTNEQIARAEGWEVDITVDFIEGGLAIDSSGSMARDYTSGSVQMAGNFVLGYYAAVDKSGSFPAWFFDTDVHPATELSADNFQGWVHKNAPEIRYMTNLFGGIYQGAEQAAKALNKPKIMDLVAFNTDWSGNFKSWKTPYEQLQVVPVERIFHFTVICDGGPTVGPGNRSAGKRDMIKQLIQRMSYTGIFIKFIFIGRDEEGEEFLQAMDDLKVAYHDDDPQDNNVRPGSGLVLSYVDNVDKVAFPSGLKVVSKKEFAVAMNQELGSFVRSALKRGTVLPS